MPFSHRVASWTAEPTQSPRKGRLPRPDHDPFYEPSAGYQGLAPGTILRSREIAVAFMGRVPQQVRAWQLLYRTCDLNGVPEATVTTVLLPADADPAEPRPLVSYQCAIDALSDRCFPSYTLQRGARVFGAVPSFELLVIAGLVHKGWAVSVPDHEGRQGYFGAAREPGYRALDGVRAALAFAPLGLEPTTPVGVVGYSGGGMASAWTAEMAPEYAPELNIVGAALGAPVGDPGQTFIRLNGGRHAALPALVVAGLRHIYPGLGRLITEHANFDGMRKLKELEDLTTVQALARFRKNDFDDYIDVPLADLLATPEVLHVFEDLRMGHRIPTCPLLVVQGTHDQMIHVDDVDSMVERYLEGGATVSYVRDQTSEHVSLQPLATPLMFGFLADRFAGKPAPSGVRTVRTVALSPRALTGYLAMGAAALRTLLGRRH